MIRAIVLNEGDNVATLIDAGAKGAAVTLLGERRDSIVLADEVLYGHKLAIRAVASGDPIVKYGKVIGRSTQAISVGQHVHVHNVEALRARGDVKVSA